MFVVLFFGYYYFNVRVYRAVINMHFIREFNRFFFVNRDASCLLHTEYSVTVEECVSALFKAKWYGFFDFDDFDVAEYEKYEVN